jgi:hypothetical protein
MENTRILLALTTLSNLQQCMIKCSHFNTLLAQKFFCLFRVMLHQLFMVYI